MDKDIKKLFKEKGLRVTPQRFGILRIIENMDAHPTAEDIFEITRKKFSNISFDTVYRTLSLFEKYGIIKKAHYFESKILYDTNTQHHHHFICTRCKKIIDFSWDDVDDLNLPKEVGLFGRAEDRYVEIRGICNECLKKEQGS